MSNILEFSSTWYTTVHIIYEPARTPGTTKQLIWQGYDTLPGRPALKRFLAEKPNAKGLAVAGMPIGSPGMDGGKPEKYEVVLFGPDGRRSYMSFIGEQSV